MTFVIKADTDLTNPLPDTPVIPDIDSGLYFRFKASDLSLANGATVDSWEGVGPAPAANRTLNVVAGSNWVKPVYSTSGGPGGAPTVVFNGTNSHIRTTDANVTAYNGPHTIAMVCSGVTNGTSSHNARFFGASVGTSLTIQPREGGTVYEFVQGAPILDTPNPGGHFVVVASLSPTALVGGISSLPGTTSVAAPSGFSPGYAGFGIGGSFAGTPNAPLNGTVTEIVMYNRALGAGDIDALIAQLRSEYGI